MEIAIQLKKGMIKGNSVYLQDEDIIKIHNFFEKQCLIEYVGENNPNWSDEKLVFVANRAYEICNEFADNKNEYYAIESALEEWEEKND